MNKIAAIILTTLGLLVMFLNSCYKEQIIAEGEGLPDWTAATHGCNASPNYTEVFNSDIVHRIDIKLDPVYWEIMIENLDDMSGSSNAGAKPPVPPDGGGNTPVADDGSSANPAYVPCSVFWNDIEWYFVGLRFKGNSSLSSAYSSGNLKLPLRLEFDYFENQYPQITGQSFYGFSQLALSSNFDDKSLMREKTAADLFREFGVPAPRTSFCRVYIDYGDGPVYFGLYTIVEVVFDKMLADQFGSNTGNCYKPEGTGASFAIGTFNTEHFYKKTNESAADWTDVETLFNVLHDDSRLSDPEKWKSDLEVVFDVNGFLRWMAVNTTIQNWDTYGLMTHNYYLYHDPSDGLIKWIPWDNNEAFQEGKMSGALSVGLTEVTDDWPLISFIMGQEEYVNIYKSYLTEFVNTTFEPSKMQTTYQQQYDLIQPYVTGTDGENKEHTFLTSASDFDNALIEIKNHVSQRKAAVEAYVN
jgi:spore coat protein CotH